MNPKGKQGTTIETSLPLQGKTVLVTRPKDQAAEFATLLASRGASIVFIPTIQIVSPQSWDEFDDTIRTIEEYDGIIFTSANAVRAFFHAWTDRGLESVRNNLGKKIFYVVGEKTGESLIAEGLTPTLLSSVANGLQLAEAMARTQIRGKRFLFPHGSLAHRELAETLRSKGAQVDELAVYETVAPRDKDLTSIRSKFEREAIDIVTFFSPSSVENLLAAVSPKLLSSKIIAVIGTSTEAAAKEAGLPVHVIPLRPTSTDLVDAIVQYFKE